MKNVLIDFSKLNSMCGFGDICRNYASRLSQIDTDDIQFTFLVPKNAIGRYGNKIKYIEYDSKYKIFPYLLPKFDLWHATDQQFRFRRHTKKTIQLLTIHDLNFLYEKTPLKIRKYMWKTQRMIDRSDYITTISHYVKEDINSHLKLHNKPIQVIYNGIRDLTQEEESMPAFVIDPDEKFFFTIGQIRAKKNFHILVKLMKYFPQHRLYICGDDHFDYSETIRHTIAEEGCGRSFLTGKISQKEKCWLYRHCNAFLFPSKLEGFGIPVLEAMCFGRAVFAAPYSSLPEVCDKYAFIWNDLNPKTMAHTIQDGLNGFYENKTRLNAIKQYARSFNYERYTDEYMALYRKLLYPGLV